MLETEPDKPPRSTLQVFLGFLLGVVASLGCLFLAIFLGSTLGSSRDWVFPVFNAIALIAVGIVALRQARESSFALGVVIALSLALLLDAACGVASIR
jgi:hypothetical protein